MYILQVLTPITVTHAQHFFWKLLSTANESVCHFGDIANVYKRQHDRGPADTVTKSTELPILKIHSF